VSKSSFLQQPKAVWAVAFACVIAFMGIGLVDPILKPIADQLHATPSQVSLLFTSYMAIMGVAMLITGAVSSRLGAKRTLLTGLAVIVVFSALAGMSNSVTGIVAFRAGWGLGNALFIATALAAIVNSASGSVGEAIILYEAALGVGIATGPLVGGELGTISWRAPFYGVAVLMLIALLATWSMLPPTPLKGRRASIVEPLKALRNRGLATVAVTALLYNFGFFTVLAFTPFPLAMSARQIGLIFFGWGVCVAITSVFVAPRLQARFGTLPVIMSVLTLFAVDLFVMGLGAEHKPVLVAGVIVAGLFLGINNTLITEAVMGATTLERSTASAAYSFVRFVGGAIAPWLAGKLGEEISVHMPFFMGALAVVLAVAALGSGWKPLAHLRVPTSRSEEEAEALTVADA
jgi:predicted MFS family arabinose efflux permease